MGHPGVQQSVLQAIGDTPWCGCVTSYRTGPRRCWSPLSLVSSDAFAPALTGYEELGREILRQTRSSGVTVDVFCAGVGTGGMLAGVSGALRGDGGGTRVVDLEPASSPMLTAGTAGPRVEGLATRREGVFTGTSGALNVVGAVRLAGETGGGHTVVTVAPDTGLKYLMGDLFGG
ncbi:hypothetical protein ACGFNV_39930 [Streptomyces sp. NPDC048751]|uniref:hypothetical protein n=1 Tax=Streptomyces sp. NPDC048751 TaxID=3365591 RepID=UPI0037129734